MISPEKSSVEMPNFKRICSWCDKDLGEKENLTGDTHGLCSECSSFLNDKVIKKEISRKHWEEGVEVVNLIGNTILRKEQILELLIMKHRSLISVFADTKLTSQFPLADLPKIAERLKEFLKLP